MMQKEMMQPVQAAEKQDAHADHHSSDEPVQAERIELQAGVPTELVFTRTNLPACAPEVHIPELGIDKTELPGNEAVSIAFTPEEPGAFEFLCGMDMLRGELIVVSYTQPGGSGGQLLSPIMHVAL